MKTIKLKDLFYGVTILLILSLLIYNIFIKSDITDDTQNKINEAIAQKDSVLTVLKSVNDSLTISNKKMDKLNKKDIEYKKILDKLSKDINNIKFKGSKELSNKYKKILKDLQKKIDKGKITPIDAIDREKDISEMQTSELRLNLNLCEDQNYKLFDWRLNAEGRFEVKDEKITTLTTDKLALQLYAKIATKSVEDITTGKVKAIKDVDKYKKKWKTWRSVAYVLTAIIGLKFGLDSLVK